MINILSAKPVTVDRLLAQGGPQIPMLRAYRYQDVLSAGRLPAGHLIFTDFDLLSYREIECAARLAKAAVEFDPAIRVLNRPTFVAERFELLAALRKLGLSEVEALRLDSGDIPAKFPVFIRLEDQADGPETDLLLNEQEYLAAVEQMRNRGVSVKRRIALTFKAQPAADGFFRKFGVFKIGDRIIPQHIMRNSGWVVKGANVALDDQFVQEELEFVQTNPHETQLREVFAAGRIDFGRVDYSFVDGKLVVFEINTNPTFPGFKTGNAMRSARRPKILADIRSAFQSIDEQAIRPGVIRFERLGRLPKATGRGRLRLYATDYLDRIISRFRA